MKTRSATKAQRVEEEEEKAAEPLPLDKLAPEVLNIIAEKLAADEDVLLPKGHLNCLARSCKVIKEAVRDAKDKLKVKYNAASALVAKCGNAVELEWSQTRTTDFERFMEERPTRLNWQNGGLTAADAPALTNVLKSKAMERVGDLFLYNNNLGDEGAAAITAAVAGGGLPRLNLLSLNSNGIGDAGVQALASAFAGGACRELDWLGLGNNAMGDAGIAALAAALDKGALPALKALILLNNQIGAEGIKALMAAACSGLAKLEYLTIESTNIGEEGIGALADALDKGDLPSLTSLNVNVEHYNNPQLRAAIYKHFPQGAHRFRLNNVYHDKASFMLNI